MRERYGQLSRGWEKVPRPTRRMMHVLKGIFALAEKFGETINWGWGKARGLTSGRMCGGKGALCAHGSLWHSRPPGGKGASWETSGMRPLGNG
ncbi:hypothetical protein QJS10_CPB20g00789 [Acorus calamus]|uniref:Uncharacterized protein n=1 Tax=Acorus calamus TaxID=4465 RepID=A0AAV9CFT0_ACOCL|nr:hypothetical protein QJS10_CPB20g00789 [Acorus calamus]